MTDPRLDDPETIYHWRRLDPTLTTSGQPSEQELADIAAIGVRHVINLALHTHPSALVDEAASAAALGLAYTHIPVAFENPTEQDFARFCTAMQQPGPTHVHCIANYRVSAFIFRHRRQILGWTAEAASPDLDAIWQPDAVWRAFVGLPDPD